MLQENIEGTHKCFSFWTDGNHPKAQLMALPSGRRTICGGVYS